MNPTDDSEAEPSKKRVRKSRFDDAAPVPVVSDVVAPIIQSNEAALLAAAELTKKIMNEKIIQENAMKAAAMQSQLASQIASISTILKTAQSNVQPTSQPKEKKPQYHALRLDSLGREIDEHGNLVKQDVGQIKTLALNNSVVAAKRKKENPYLAHRAPPPIPVSVPGLQSALPSSATASSSTVIGTSTTGAIHSDSQVQITQSAVMASSTVISETTLVGQPSTAAENEEVMDDRITTTNRDRRRKKALRFVEPGKYVQIA